MMSTFGGAVSHRIGTYLQNFKTLIKTRRLEKTGADDRQRRSHSIHGAHVGIGEIPEAESGAFVC